MGAWTKNKTDSSQINGGQEYTKNSNVALDQLNAITNNSFYAVDKADEALEKANSAFENNGTVVSVGGSAVPTLSFNSDPQEQINSKASVNDLNTANSNISSLTEDKANKDLSNVTYPEIVYNEGSGEFDGLAHTGAGDRVIESFISTDGGTWYRIWESGWKECGTIKNSSNGEMLVTFPIRFSTPYYTYAVGASSNTRYCLWRAQIVSEESIRVTMAKSTSEINDATSQARVYACGY